MDKPITATIHVKRTMEVQQLVQESLSQREQHLISLVLQLVRQPNGKGMVIQKGQNGMLVTIEDEVTVQPEEIPALLKAQAFQDVTFKQHNGKTAAIRRVIRHKL